MVSRTNTAIMQGLESIKVEVEVDSNRGAPNLILIGLAAKAIDEAKERITSALTNCGVRIRSRRTVVNLAPADVHKRSSAVELAIAVGMLKMYGEINIQTDDTMFFGELSLDGELKPIRGALPLVLAAKAMGFKKVVLPNKNAPEVSVISGIQIHPIAHLKELLSFAKDDTPLSVIEPKPFSKPEKEAFTLDFADIIGQEQAKRALEIAAAGGHNILLNGTPGSGKSMMAKAMVSILPPLTEREAIETTNIYSVSGLIKQDIMKIRPFRSPHHTTSQVGLIGGGSNIKPGEISLAHRGILFLDEFPEFSRHSLEALRQPLEDGVVTISRAIGSATYPARFTLVAAANPCPCGYQGSRGKPCSCSHHSLEQYQKKLSGPILDRIDLHIRVQAVEVEKITKKQPGERETSSSIRSRVESARAKQRQRFIGSEYHTNAELNTKDVKIFCPLPQKGQDLLTQATKKLSLSARSYFKLIKVARTVADLEGEEEINTTHMAEALQYRDNH